MVVKLSKKQIEKGIIILVAFVLLRAIMAEIGGVSQGVQFGLHSVLFLITTFLVLSVGLVYFGFAKWVGVDMKKWWYDGKRILGDVGWGVLGSIIVFILALSIIAPITMLGFAPMSSQGTRQHSPVEYLMTVFFGLAIASFQEETIFRGFLQNVLTERFGKWQGNILQAATFSIAHIGYYTLNAWPLFLLAFILGIAFGWLKMSRGTLLAPWIAHGLFG